MSVVCATKDSLPGTKVAEYSTSNVDICFCPDFGFEMNDMGLFDTHVIAFFLCFFSFFFSFDFLHC